MKLEDLIDRALIESEPAPTRKQAIERLAQRLQQQGCITGAQAFCSAVARHEAEAASELSPTVAVPHATDKSVLRSAVALGRTAGSETVFLIASRDSEEHIKTLAALAGALLDGENAEELF